MAPETAKFDLGLSLQEVAGGISGTLSYNAELFEAATMRRLLTHYQRLLEGIVSNPSAALTALPLLSESEARQVLEEWNETAVEYPKQWLQQRFETQAGLTPEAIALVAEEQAVSYGELNERANQLAHYLGEQGVGVETLVAVCLERSIEMVVSLLGILKAGAAYVPLDPAYPQERLAFMLSDSAASLLLTQQQLVAQLPAPEERTVCIDSEWGEIARHSRANPEPQGTTANLAYVIYTSGSTGQPKGVAIAHQSASAFLHWAGEVFSPSQLAGVLASTSICFDLSIFELFVPLSQGGTVLLSENVLALPALAAAQQVTLINTVPSAMAELVRLGGLPASVRTINLAGEALPNSLVQAIYQQPTVAQVFNLYGPSEDTTYSTYTLVKKGAAAAVSIGRPVANTQVYVLDVQQQPVPQGIAGELCLGGEGLARGYLQRPELTAEKFVPNPFGQEPGTRLYRTGDLVRYLAAGELDYLGRADQQVKLRGFRIELEEIQAVLNQHAAVRESLLLVREDHAGDKRLVAYVVGAEGAAGSVEQWRRYLKERLPEYMIPAAFVVLDKFPLTPNGKLDRRALPLPELSAAADSQVAPRTPVEELVAQVWREVLHVERVGVTDNFFALGGHSLLATQVISRLRSALTVDVPLRSLFEQPTVAGLAQCVETALRGGERVALPPLQQARRDEVLPLSFAQQRLWFIEQLEPESATYNMPASLRLTGWLDCDALQRTLSEVVRRHEVLRTTFVNYGGQPRQQITAEARVALPLIDLSALVGGALEAEVERLARAEAGRPFDLSVGPLLRVQLLRLSEEEHVVLLTLHHIISDGWSMGILIKEVAALYSAYNSDSPSPLSELAIQYADYAVWQREWLQGEVLEEQLQYWRAQLTGAPPLLALATDHPRPLMQHYRGGAEELQFIARG